jgi:RNA polymerase sigma-70 factor (ECF subfamily)
MSARTRFEDLALPHKDAAYNLAYWIVRNADDAEDVVQDAYLRAFRAFDGFKGEAMRPWLLAIVRNAAFRVLLDRKRANNVVSFDFIYAADDSVDGADFASPDPSAEAVLISEGEARRLYAALAELPLAYRDIVVLREMENLSYGEIAEIAGIAIGTVMSRLSRGRALLRKAIERRKAEDEPNEV